ncbi:MAG: hypothetical protein ABDH28_00090 [Brevinematia bacterium]
MVNEEVVRIHSDIIERICSVIPAVELRESLGIKKSSLSNIRAGRRYLSLPMVKKLIRFVATKYPSLSIYIPDRIPVVVRGGRSSFIIYLDKEKLVNEML